MEEQTPTQTENPTAPETPEAAAAPAEKVKVKVIIDPSSPEAGKNGVIPPKEYRWKPGVQPKGGGTKKGVIRVTDHLRNYMAKLSKDGKTEIGEKMAKMAISKALKGDFRFFKDVVDRLDGTALQRIQAEVQANPNQDLEFATDEELATIEGIMLKCQARKVAAGLADTEGV